jgi:arylsulfatase A-like enzyme
MSYPSGVSMAAVILLFAGIARAAEPAPKATSMPNVVVILADDLGYGDIGAYNPAGKVPTPNVDRLARQGVRFTDAHSSSAVCTPTRYGLLTGRYAWRSRLERGVLWGEGAPLVEPDRLTLASMLKARGYATAAIGKWHLGLGWAPLPGRTPSTTTRNQIDWIDFTRPFTGGPTSLGFDRFFGITASLDMPPYVYLENDRVAAAPTTTLPGVPEGDPAFYRAGIASPGFHPQSVLPDLTARAVAYVAERGADPARRPFLLYLALAAPHTPVMPTPPFRGRTGIGPYGDFVAETDDAVGQVLRALDDARLASDTLVLFASDNGPAPLGGIAEAASHGHDASGGWRGVKAGLYEGGHRVPFVIRWPGVVAPGTTSTRVVATTDVVATIAGVVGAPLPRTAAEDSISFAEELRAPAKDASRGPALVLHSQNGSFAVRDGRFKLILTHSAGTDDDPPLRDPGRTPPRQLYDLAADPKETTNLAALHPEIASRLEGVLRSYREAGRSR